ncbi:MAG: M20/M25/M40 family metallo-hydrolase [Planctomycetota bacterium]
MTTTATQHLVEIAADRRTQHHRWLQELTGIPTAAGREDRVVAWTRRWVAERPELAIRADAHGNLVIRRTEPFAGDSPVYVTAHLDHPAFVVEAIEDDRTLVMAFRGGVMEDYFAGTPVAVHSGSDATAQPRRGVVVERVPPAEGEKELFKRYRVRLDDGNSTAGLTNKDFGTWALPASEVVDGVLHAPACDDLAAAAAALAAMDELLRLRAAGERVGRDVRLLFTRAEEIGFVGALGAARDRTMEAESTVIALENSRAFDDSPLGGGPIVRVGDRLSVFTPRVTAAVASRAEAVAGGPASPTAAQKHAEMPKWRWQRKLMAGGACEATVFCAAGYDATCVCLPLGNYHNMADLAAVQAGAHGGRPTIEREFIDVGDFDGLVDLLVACGIELRPGGSIDERLDRLWHERRFVLEESDA